MQHEVTRIDDLLPDGNGGYLTERSAHEADRLQYNLSAENVALAKNFCGDIVKDIIAAKLPKTIMDKPELSRIVELHSKFEVFSLQSMFVVVSRAMRLMESFDVEDIYDMTGMVDLGKVNAQMMLQQQVMNLLTQFSMHVRRLPAAITDIIREVESTQYIEIQEVSVNGQEEPQGQLGMATSKPIAQLLREAQSELAVEAIEEPEVPTMPPTEKEIIDTEDVNENELDL